DVTLLTSSHIICPPPISTLFPYTTLFRSVPALATKHGSDGPDLAPSRSAIGQPRPKRHSSIPWPSLPQPARCGPVAGQQWRRTRSEEHTSELQSRENLVCRLLLEKKNKPT